MNTGVKADLIFAQVVGGQIDEYVRTEVLFYPVGSVAGVAMPQLTIGTWLETAWRLRARSQALTAEQQASYEAARAGVQRVRSLWPAPYQHKAQREFKSRLDSWSWYLDEVLGKEGPLSQQGAGYATQVHVLLKLHLLRDGVSQLSGELARLDYCDRRLRTRFVTGPFVWEPDLESAAPRETMWFLYGQLI